MNKRINPSPNLLTVKLLPPFKQNYYRIHFIDDNPYSKPLFSLYRSPPKNIPFKVLAKFKCLRTWQNLNALLLMLNSQVRKKHTF